MQSIENKSDNVTHEHLKEGVHYHSMWFLCSSNNTGNRCFLEDDADVQGENTQSIEDQCHDEQWQITHSSQGPDSPVLSPKGNSGKGPRSLLTSKHTWCQAGPLLASVMTDTSFFLSYLVISFWFQHLFRGFKLVNMTILCSHSPQMAVSLIGQV